LSEYRDHHDELRAAGVRLAAISVDDPARADAMRRDLKLPFPLLCDPQREAIRAWDLVNTAEGDIAFPAAFVIDREMRVRYRALESTTARVRVADVIAAARAIASGGAPARTEGERHAIWPGAMFFRATMNMLTRGIRSKG
jgi:peroxiredoxin